METNKIYPGKKYWVDAAGLPLSPAYLDDFKDKQEYDEAVKKIEYLPARTMFKVVEIKKPQGTIHPWFYVEVEGRNGWINGSAFLKFRLNEAD